MILRIFVTLLSIILGCSDGNPTAPKPEPVTNKPPIIDRLILPAEVESNTPVKLRVIARDPDKNELTVIWQVSKGKVDADVWTPPDHTTSVVVSVHVSDGTNPTITQQNTVKVIASEQPISDPPPNPQPIQPPVPEPMQPRQQPTPEPEPEPDPIADFQPGIQPGVGIAAIRVGDTLAEVEAVHGKSVKIPNGFAYQDLGLGFSLKNNRVNVLLLFPPDKLKLKTKAGNGIGSLKSHVEKEFGRAEKVDITGGEITFWYFTKGIAFIYDINNRVEVVTVFKPIR